MTKLSVATGSGGVSEHSKAQEVMHGKSGKLKETDNAEKLDADQKNFAR